MNICTRLALAAAALFLMAATPAKPPVVYDGFAPGQLATVLTGLGFEVTGRSTSGGNQYYSVKDPETGLSIGAVTIRCGQQQPCAGIALFVQHKLSHPTPELLNAMNLKVPFVKYVRTEDGLASLYAEHVAKGGITSDNVLESFGALYAGMNAYERTIELKSAAATKSPPVLGLDNVRSELKTIPDVGTKFAVPDDAMVDELLGR